jgi:hypothetical protein
MVAIPPLPSEELVELRDVTAVAATPGILICRLGQQEFHVAEIMVKGGDIRRAGDTGTLVLPRWLATNLGLIGPPPR